MNGPRRWFAAAGAALAGALLTLPGAACAAPFYDASAKCFDTSQVGRVIDLPDLGSFQIHLLGDEVSDQVAWTSRPRWCRAGSASG